MKVNMIKLSGGIFSALNDFELEKLNKFKTGEAYEIELRLPRNPTFLKKVMVFFHFCFEHWDGDKAHEHCSPQEQFNRFRKDLTILAGFYEQSFRLNGELRTEAKSLSFASMSEEEFQECYNGLIRASMKHIFKSSSDETYQKLIGFF